MNSTDIVQVKPVHNHYRVLFSDSILLPKEPIYADISCDTSLNTVLKPLGQYTNLVHIEVNGTPIDLASSEYKEIYPNDGSLVTIHVIPQKTAAGRVVAMVAIMVIAWALGPVVAGALNISNPLAIALIQAGIATAGAIAYNALVPLELPETPEDSGSLYSISNIRNKIDPWGVIPQPFGKIRLYPNYAANAYTEHVGNDQYINALFVLGQFPNVLPDISDTKIGDTLTSDMPSVVIDITRDPVWPDIVEQSLLISLSQPVGVYGDADDGADFYIGTTAPNTNIAVIDMSWPAGMIKTDKDGDTNALKMEFLIEYSLAGQDSWVTYMCDDNLTASHQFLYNELREWDGNNIVWKDNKYVSIVDGVVTETWYTSGDRDWEDWLPGEANYPGGEGARWRMHRHTHRAFRKSIAVFLPSSNQWDVRITRVMTKDGDYGPGEYTKDPSWDSWGNRDTSEQFSISAFKSYQDTPASDVVPTDQDFVYAKLRVRATDQLSGVLDAFNLVISTHPRVYLPETQAWLRFTTSTFTRNPAWNCLEMLTQPGQNARPYPEDNIDLDAFYAWGEWCRLNNFNYDEVISTQKSVWEHARRMAHVGRAELTFKDGKLSVIQDNAIQTPVQVFTERNSRNFSGTRLYIEDFHGVKVRYLSENDNYLPTERIVYREPYNENNATLFEVLELPGVTDDNQAYKEGWRFMAMALLRPEIFVVEVDVEHIICQRGDTVRLQNYGAAFLAWHACRINNAIGANGFWIDEIVTLPDTGPFKARIRYADAGGNYTELVTTITDDPLTSSSIFLTSDPIPAICTGAIVLIGTEDEEYFNCKVTNIVPLEDLNARIEMVPESPDLYSADSGVIPPYTPLITSPIDRERGALSAPVNIQTDDSYPIWQTNPDGSWKPRLLVSYDIPSNNGDGGTDSFEAQLRYRRIPWTEANWSGEGGPDVNIPTEEWTYSSWQIADGTILIDDFTQGYNYQIQVRLRVWRGQRTSPWSVTKLHISDSIAIDPTKELQGMSIEDAVDGVYVIIDINGLDIFNASYMQIAYSTNNVVDAVEPTVYNVALIRNISEKVEIRIFVPIDVIGTYYFWARLFDTTGSSTPLFPGETSNITGTVLEAAFYSIRASAGLNFKNGAGTKELDIVKSVNGVITQVTSGSRKLYLKDDTNELGDGYTWTDITVPDDVPSAGSIIVELKDLSGPTVYDTVTISDIVDGSSGTLAIIAKKGYSTFWLGDAGAVFIHGVDGAGVPADVDGEIEFGGLLYTVPRATYLKPIMSNYLTYKSTTGPWDAWIVFETNNLGGIGPDSRRVFVATKEWDPVAKVNTWTAHSHAWAPTYLAFTPTNSMTVIGSISGGYNGDSDDVISSVTVWVKGFTPGAIANADATRNIGDLADLDLVDTAQIAPTAVDFDRLATGLEVPEVWAGAAFPVYGTDVKSKVILWEKDYLLYRWNGSAWLRAAANTNALNSDPDFLSTLYGGEPGAYYSTLLGPLTHVVGAADTAGGPNLIQVVPPNWTRILSDELIPIDKNKTYVIRFWHKQDNTGASYMGISAGVQFYSSAATSVADTAERILGAGNASEDAWLDPINDGQDPNYPWVTDLAGADWWYGKIDANNTNWNEYAVTIGPKGQLPHAAGDNVAFIRIHLSLNSPNIGFTPITHEVGSWRIEEAVGPSVVHFDAITTGAIAAGVVGAREVQTESLTTSKIKVVPKKRALNDDPNFSENEVWPVAFDPDGNKTAWSIASTSYSSITKSDGFSGDSFLRIIGDGVATSVRVTSQKKIPIKRDAVYAAEITYRNPNLPGNTGDDGLYIGIEFFDQNGDVIDEGDLTDKYGWFSGSQCWLMRDLDVYGNNGNQWNTQKALFTSKDSYDLGLISNVIAGGGGNAHWGSTDPSFMRITISACYAWPDPNSNTQDFDSLMIYEVEDAEGLVVDGSIKGKHIAGETITGDNIYAGSLTVGNFKTSMAGDNLIAGGDYLEDPSAWEAHTSNILATTGWIPLEEAPEWSLITSADPTKFGSNALQCTISSGSQYSVIRTAKPIPIYYWETSLLECYVQASTGSQNEVALIVIFYDKNGDPCNTAVYDGWLNSLVGANWWYGPQVPSSTYNSPTYVAGPFEGVGGTQGEYPTDAVSMRFFILAADGSNPFTATSTTLIQRPRFRKMVAGVEISGNTIEGKHVATDTLEGRSMILKPSLADNLIPDERLDDFTMWRNAPNFSDADGLWVYVNEAITDEEWAIAPSGSPFYGTNALRYKSLDGTTNRSVRTNLISIDPTENYLIDFVWKNAYGSGTPCTVAAYIIFYDYSSTPIVSSNTGWVGGSTTYHGIAGNVTPAADNTWESMQIAFGGNDAALVPSNAVYCRFMFRVFALGSPSTELQHILIQRPRLRRKIASNLYVDGSIFGQHIYGKTITSGAIADNTLTGLQLGATLDLSSGTNTTITSAASGYRVELEGAGTYPIWYGTSTKNATNAKFYVNSSGDLYVEGDINANVFETDSVFQGRTSNGQLANLHTTLRSTTDLPSGVDLPSTPIPSLTVRHWTNSTGAPYYRMRSIDDYFTWHFWCWVRGTNTTDVARIQLQSSVDGEAWTDASYVDIACGYIMTYMCATYSIRGGSIRDTSLNPWDTDLRVRAVIQEVSGPAIKQFGYGYHYIINNLGFYDL